MKLNVDLVFKIVYEYKHVNLITIRLLSKQFRNYVDKYYIRKLELHGEHREWYSLPVTKLFIDLSCNEDSLLDWNREVYSNMEKCNTFNYFLEKCFKNEVCLRLNYFNEYYDLISFRIIDKYRRITNCHDYTIKTLKGASFFPAYYYIKRHDIDMPFDIFISIKRDERNNYISKLNDKRAKYYIKLAYMCKIPLELNLKIIRIRQELNLYFKNWELKSYEFNTRERDWGELFQLIDFKNMKEDDLKLYDGWANRISCKNYTIKGDRFYIKILEHIIYNKITLKK